LPSELGKLSERVAVVEDDRAAEAEQLSQLTMEISNALVILNVVPIQGIPSQLRLVKDVMVAFTQVLELLREKAPIREPNAYLPFIPIIFFLARLVYGVHKYIYICVYIFFSYPLMYKKNLCPYIPVSPHPWS
jgi:hypothetical protein